MQLFKLGCDFYSQCAGAGAGERCRAFRDTKPHSCAQWVCNEVEEASYICVALAESIATAEGLELSSTWLLFGLTVRC